MIPILITLIVCLSTFLLGATVYYLKPKKERIEVQIFNKALHIMVGVKPLSRIVDGVTKKTRYQLEDDSIRINIARNHRTPKGAESILTVINIFHCGTLVFSTEEFYNAVFRKNKQPASLNSFKFGTFDNPKEWQRAFFQTQ